MIRCLRDILVLCGIALSAAPASATSYVYGDFRYNVVQNSQTREWYAELKQYVGSSANVTIPASIVYEYETNFDENGHWVSDTLFHETVVVPVVCDDWIYFHPTTGYADNKTLTSLTIEAPLTITPDCSRCPNLRTVVLPETIETISDSSFTKCSIESINLPKNVKTIDSYAFSGCSKLVQISLPEKLTEIWEGAFQYCSSLKQISLPKNLTKIGCGAFVMCSNLESLVIPDSVTKIEANAFSGCYTLSAITLPPNVSLGRCAFRDCTSLSQMHLPAGTNMELVGNDGLSGFQFASCTNLLEVAIDDGVETLPDSCFYMCVNLSTVSIPSTVTNINPWCFQGCVSLDDVHIDSANNFYGVINGFIVNKRTMDLIAGPGKQEYVMIPDGIGGVDGVSLSSGIYNTYRQMKYLTIPQSVTNMNSYAFWMSKNLKYIKFFGKPPVCDEDFKIDENNSPNGVVGFFSPEFRDEWNSVIDEDGYWYGLKMEVAKSSYTVSYNSNGGSGVIEDQLSGFAGEAIVANDGSSIRRENHTFMGWSFVPDGEVIYKGGDVIAEPIDGNEVTLYAVWSQPALTLSPVDADWRVGSVSLKCTDADTSGTAHTYRLDYYNQADNAWVAADGDYAKNVQLDSDGYAHLSDSKYASRNNGVGTVTYRVVDENGRSAECITRYRHGLFIGVDEYQNNWCKLDGHFDHYLLASTFAGSYTRYGGKCGYVKVLHGTETKRETVFIQLDYISESIAVPGDIVLFYYVGHGRESLVTCWNENDGIIYANELAERFKGFPPGTAVVAIFDSCHSAGLMDRQYDWDKDGNIGWIVASQEDQNAYCGQLKSVICDNGWLKGKADIVGSNVEADGNGYVTFAELALWGQDWMGDKKNYEGDDALYDFGQLMSFYNSSVLRNIVAGSVPENTSEDKEWSWLKSFKKAWTNTDGDLSSAATTLSANGVRSIEDCYVLGLDPDDPNDDFRITHFEMVNGEPVFELNHTTNGAGESFLPQIRKLGKTDLKDSWSEVPPGGNPSHRFFTVEVETP